jgi:hypothetical protein
MSSEGFEPTISADERPQTYDLEGAITGTGDQNSCWNTIDDLCKNTEDTFIIILQTEINVTLSRNVLVCF